MNKPKVLIRADGNNKVGLGHISRCCALAGMLKDDFDIFFHTRTSEQAVLDEIKKYCTDVSVLNDAITYKDEASLWVSALNRDEIVVLDGYKFDTNYQEKIKEKGCTLVCIDDINAYHFVADAVINHAPGIKKEIYSAEAYTQFYLGIEYVLLKKIFLDEALKQPAIANLKQSPILVCFGGADPNNITGQTLKEIIHLFPQKTINVVIGIAYAHLQLLKQFAITNTCVELHQNIQPEEMLALMQQSHIAVTSASTTALEYICVKGNLFLKCIADNQKEMYASLIEKNSAYSFEKINEKIFSTDNICNQHALIDGKSRWRLKKIFYELSSANEIVFRKAKPDMADLLFNWINDPEVRTQSLLTKPISYAEHSNWFTKKIADKNCYLYIVYNSSLPIGMIRFDINYNSCTISYLVDKSQRGKGIGTSIIKLGIEQFKNDSNFKGFLKAVVKNINIASLKIFDKCGFERENTEGELVFFKVNVE